MVHRKKYHEVIGHVIQQPYCLKKIFKPSKIIFSEVAEQIEVKLYMYDRLSMRNKRFTHIIGHMAWQPYWIDPKTYENTPLKINPEWVCNL